MRSTFRLGIFVVGTLAILIGGIFLIGSKRMSFRSTYRLKTEFENVAGLSNGADVRVGGIHEGTVERIDLPDRPDGKVTVEMDVAPGALHVVKKDSKASIAAEGLVGDKYVAISFGTTDGGELRNGDTIASEPPLEMSALFKKTDEILNQAQNAMQSVNGVTKDLQSISGKINSGQGSVGALINDKALYQRVNSGAEAFQEDMEALKHNFLLRGFFQNRGYEDTGELTKNRIRQLPAGPVNRTFSYDARRLFDKPSTAKLKNDKALNDAGQFLERNPFGLVVVEARGGGKGDSKEEAQLTEARAAVVRDYLVHNFRLDDTRVKTLGLGKSAASDGDAVEILVYQVSSAPPQLASKR